MNDYLTPRERLCAMRVGGIRKLASMGMSVSEFNDVMEKSAQTKVESAIDTAIRLSIMTGVPVGIMTYAMGRAVRPKKRQNAKAKAVLDELNDIAARYRREFAPKEAPNATGAV